MSERHDTAIDHNSEGLLSILVLIEYNVNHVSITVDLDQLMLIKRVDILWELARFKTTVVKKICGAKYRQSIFRKEHLYNSRLFKITEPEPSIGVEADLVMGPFTPLQVNLHLVLVLDENAFSVEV